MNYGSPAGAFIRKRKLNCMQVVENRALGVIGGYNKYARTETMHFDNKIHVFKSYIRTLTLKMYAST